MNSAHKRFFTLSNILSFLRLLLAPIVAFRITQGQWGMSAALFALGGLTDLLDGYLARALREQTLVGHYLDPIADKVFVLSSLAALAHVGLKALALPFWFLWLALAREAIILCGGALMMWRSVGGQIRPLFLGKMTTAGYMALIGWILVCVARGWAPTKSFFMALSVVSSLALFSLIEYCILGFKALSQSPK